MDSLRYWVLDMHVDGFRFDLASALARELYDVDKLGAFFVGEDGAPIVGDTLVYLLNAAASPIPFTLPSFVAQPRWENILDTFDAGREGQVFEGGAAYPLAEHSLAVFRLRRGGEDPAA